MIYRLIIKSKIDNGCIIYNSAHKRILKTLNTIQHSALRLITGAFRTSHIVSLQNITGEPPFSHRRLRLTFKYIYNISANNSHPTIRHIFTNHNNTIKLKDTTTFLTTIQQELRHLNLTIPVMQDNSFSTMPPWKIIETNCNTDLSRYPKPSTK